MTYPVTLTEMACAFFLLLGLGCEQSPSITTPECSVSKMDTVLSQNEAMASLPRNLLERAGTASFPDTSGAMGNNKKAYFHVRFQMGISVVTSYGIVTKSSAIMDKSIKAMEYSFAHQLPAGDFVVTIPRELTHLGSPKAGDLASGVAFFASSAGSALMAMNESTWFHEQAEFKTRIENLRPSITRLLDFLKSSEDVLQHADKGAPNRLLFDAVAFYSLGTYLNDSDARNIGLKFAKAALASQHKQGYYIEGGGWDSSYQAVSLENGFNLLMLLPRDEPFRQTLYSSLICGARWEMSRVEDSGKISTTGNTRVYDGGEKFLGKEKAMAYKSAALSFLYAGIYSREAAFTKVADQVIKYYQ